MSDYPKVTYRKHTFLSSLAMGISAVVITVIISCTVVIIYGIHFAGDRSEKLVSLVGAAVKELPDLRKALPPALADVLDDRREPGYVANLDISAVTALTPDQHRTVRTKVEVVNKGSEIVSLTVPAHCSFRPERPDPLGVERMGRHPDCRRSRLARSAVARLAPIFRFTPPATSGILGR